MTHEHRSQQPTREIGWTECVDPEGCAADPDRQTAHGNIIIVDTCDCGATQSHELNAGRYNIGPWQGGDPTTD